MKSANKPMVWWIRFVLVSIIIILWLSSEVSEALAGPIVQFPSASEMNFDQQMPALTIEPELTNPAETPISEVQPQQISALDWFGEVMVTAETVEPDSDRADSFLNHWLASIQRLLGDQ